MLQSIFRISQSLWLTETTSQSIRLPDTTSQYIGLPKNISHFQGLPTKYFYFSHTLTKVNVNVITASLYLISEYPTIKECLCHKISSILRRERDLKVCQLLRKSQLRTFWNFWNRKLPTFECQTGGVGPCWSILHFKSNLMPRMQSAYRRHHLTETTLFRVVSDILSSADEGKVTLLGLLDLLHTILLDRMRIAFGIDGPALEWIRTFLVDRTQQDAVHAWVNCHLLSSTVMGQLSSTEFRHTKGIGLWSTSFPTHGRIVWNLQENGLVAHSFADDSQVYLRIPSAAVQQFTECGADWPMDAVQQAEVEHWQNLADMDGHAPTIVEGQSQRDQPTFLQGTTVRFSSNVSDLGVLLDSQLPVRRRIQVFLQNNYNVSFWNFLPPCLFSVPASLMLWIEWSLQLSLILINIVFICQIKMILGVFRLVFAQENWIQ